MLPDYLLSFTIWLFIALTWVPVYIHVLKQLEDSEHSKLVNELFYNYLIELKLGEVEGEHTEIEKEGTSYSIVWEKESMVCLQYEDVFQNAKKICEVWKE